jgi:hypothetical protein
MARRRDERRHDGVMTGATWFGMMVARMSTMSFELDSSSQKFTTSSGLAACGDTRNSCARVRTTVFGFCEAGASSALRAASAKGNGLAARLTARLSPPIPPHLL